MAHAHLSAPPPPKGVRALQQPFPFQLVRPNDVTDRRCSEVPTPVPAPCGACGEFRLRTRHINRRAIRADVFSKPVFTKYGTAHSHAGAPNPKRMDWPLREIGARIHPFGDAAKDPIWGRLLPKQIDCPAKDVVINLSRRDALNCYQPLRGEYDVVVGQRYNIALDMPEPGIQGHILASPRLAESQHRQIDSTLLENSKAVILAAIVDSNHLPPARGRLHLLQTVQHARQSVLAIQCCKKDSYSRHASLPSGSLGCVRKGSCHRFKGELRL